MTCLETRRELSADSQHLSARVLDHLERCAGCSRALVRARELDRRLRRALSVAPPEGLAERILLAQTTRQRQRGRWQRVAYAMAASLMLALLGGVAWQFGVRPISEAQALERYVAKHLRHEPHALEATRPVDLDRVQALLNQYGLTLADGADNIVYVNKCPTPNGTGVHLVVRTAQGPVTFIYLPQYVVDETVPLDDLGLDGYATAFQQGTMAVVGTPGEGFEQAGTRLLAAIKPL